VAMPLVEPPLARPSVMAPSLASMAAEFGQVSNKREWGVVMECGRMRMLCCERGCQSVVFVSCLSLYVSSGRGREAVVSNNDEELPSASLLLLVVLAPEKK